MSTNFLHKTFSKIFMMTLFFGLASLYCTYHLLQGQRGYFELRRMHAHSHFLAQEVDKAQSERLALEDKVMRLRGPQIDPDMLEQQALFMLGPKGRSLLQLR